MANRRDEEPKTWFRSERVFRADHEWFIHTREGIAVGPYNDKFAAEVDAEVLKSLLIGVNKNEGEGIIREFMASGGNLRRDVSVDDERADSENRSLPDEVASLLDDGLDATAQPI